MSEDYDGYVVLDGDGDHVYSAPKWDSCNDHINDCAENGHGDVGSWVIRGFYLQKKPSATLINAIESQNEH